MSASERYDKYEEMKLYDDLLASLNRIPESWRSQNWTALYSEYERKIYEIKELIDL